MESLGECEVRAVVLAIRDELEVRHEELSELDARSGDGDHGFSMRLAFRTAAADIDAEKPASISDLLRLVGNAYLNKVGGATGAIFGSAFLSAAESCQGLEQVAPTDLVRMLKAAEDGVSAIGGAKVGDRSMLDSLNAGRTRLEASIAEGKSLAAALDDAAAAAHEGAVATANMVPKVGRAVRVGNRALGHPDAGAVSVALMLQTLADLANGRERGNKGS